MLATVIQIRNTMWSLLDFDSTLSPKSAHPHIDAVL